ncbi:hypothetical protein SEA_COMRADE_187 [Streptomyces phage Comrade]|uniref:Uncharacterized protein n=1 Tax=Streptomyces phage Comrade TaxID=2301714 RepID=A0A385DVK1_9CAUD|nr:hypothetical protein HWB84_gp091 [Streptomyces phage Comrade]AXQ63424.1 hypothetical protein SEA_COMRADE_187 [Streptomyces phage Comrade]
MVIAATIIWIIGMVMVLVFGFAVALTGELHEEEPLDGLFKSWGGTRFYSLYFLILILCLPIWPLILVSIWIVALVRGW